MQATYVSVRVQHNVDLTVTNSHVPLLIAMRVSTCPCYTIGGVIMTDHMTGGVVRMRIVIVIVIVRAAARCEGRLCMDPD